MPASIWKWKMLAGLIFLTGFTNQPAFFKAKCWLNLKSCWKLKWFEELRLTGALLRSWERQVRFWGAENDRGCFKELKMTGAVSRSCDQQVRFWGAENDRGWFEELRNDRCTFEELKDTGAVLRSWDWQVRFRGAESVGPCLDSWICSDDLDLLRSLSASRSNDWIHDASHLQRIDQMIIMQMLQSAQGSCSMICFPTQTVNWHTVLVASNSGY